MSATVTDLDYPQHKEPFEVVMIKKTAAETSAKPDDFKRVRVEAENTLQAIQSDAVEKETEYRAMMAAKPGVLTDPEIHAMRRVSEAFSVTDRSKI